MNAESKLRDIKTHGKFRYSAKNVVLLRFIPLLVLIELINENFYRGFDKEPREYLLVLALKLVLIGGLGLVVGLAEYKYYKRVVARGFKSVSAMRRDYSFIYGVLSFGGVLFIALSNTFFTSTVMLAIGISTMVVGGWCFGNLLFFMLGKQAANYVLEKENE